MYFVGSFIRLQGLVPVSPALLLSARQCFGASALLVRPAAQSTRAAAGHAADAATDCTRSEPSPDGRCAPTAVA